MRQDEIECLVEAGVDRYVASRFHAFVCSRTKDATEVRRLIVTVIELAEFGYVLCEIEPGEA